MAGAGGDLSSLFSELGAVILGLALLARLARRWAFSAIPFYLLAGLAFGRGGLAPLDVSESFIHTGAEIGVLLLLFLLGLEYTGDELKLNLKTGLPAGIADFVLNFPPGLVAGFLLGLNPLTAVLLGGVTYISSSGIIAKVLGELGRLANGETPVILSVLVIEDLAMAVYLPLVSVLLVGGGIEKITASVSIAILVVVAVVWVAIRFGSQITNAVASESDEIVLLTILGLVLLVAGLAQRLQVSAAIGAFLVGIAISGPVAKRSHHLFAPLRDLFSCTFFFFFGLEIDPATLPGSLPAAAGLAAVSAATKFVSGYWAVRRLGFDRRSCVRAGCALIARGEFSIVIAGLGVASEPALGPLAAAYVLLLAIFGPVAAKLAR